MICTVFSPEEKIRNKRIQLFHHLQMSVAPQTFNPRAIYDGRAIAYAPTKLPLANNGNGTVRLLALTLFYDYLILSCSSPSNLGRQGQSLQGPVVSIRSGCPWPLEGILKPSQFEFFELWPFCRLMWFFLPSHVDDLIKHRQNTTRAQVATNLIQLVIRQGPNLYVDFLFFFPGIFMESFIRHHTNNGRAYFTDQNKHSIPKSGLELWRGIFQCVS